MNVLAFDTCFDACSVAAGRRLRSLTPSIAFATEPMTTGQAERLMPMIETVMAEASMTFAELDRIVIACGPGTFTGARIAVAAARALALATGATVVAVTSLELMAMNPAVVSGGADTIAIATDARRSEVYLQLFKSSTLQSLGPPAVRTIADAASVLGSRSVLLAGSGAADVAHAARALGTDAKAILPDLVPEAIDMLFASAALQGVASVAPLYLRPPDAKPPLPSAFAGIIAGTCA